MTLAASARSSGPAPPAAPRTVPDDGVWENAPEEVPYIEIGGPEGMTGSVLRLVATEPPARAASPAKPTAPAMPSADPHRVAPTQSPVSDTPAAKLPTSTDTDNRSFPRLAHTPLYLSVRWHPLGIPAPTRVPLEPDAALIVWHYPDHPVSSEYRQVWEAIRRQFPEPGPRLLHFAATEAEAGATTVLLNLALAAAQSETAARVLVVDAHCERPAIASRLGLRATVGLHEVLARKLPLTLAIQLSGVERLDVLAAGAGVVPPEQLGRELPLLFEQVRPWYGWVLVDGGVWGEMPHRDALCPAADAVYLICRDETFPRLDTDSYRREIRQLGGLPRGIITTRPAT